MASRSDFDARAFHHSEPAEQLQRLMDWFDTNFFDPEAERRAGIRRNYRWLPNGPIDPFDELFIVFGKQVSRWLLQAAADALAERSRNWHARPDERSIIGEGRAGRSFSVGDEVGMPLWIEPERFRFDLLTRISRLEAAVAQLAPPPPGFSHNGPPDSLDDLPLTRADIADLSKALEALRTEAQSAKPNTAAIETQAGKLSGLGKKISEWSGARANKFVDAALDTAGKTAGAAFILQVTGLMPHLSDVVLAAGKFIQALAH
jgi:hypothetical protein